MTASGKTRVVGNPLGSLVSACRGRRQAKLVGRQRVAEPPKAKPAPAQPGPGWLWCGWLAGEPVWVCCGALAGSGLGLVFITQLVRNAMRSPARNGGRRIRNHSRLERFLRWLTDLRVGGPPGSIPGPCKPQHQPQRLASGLGLVTRQGGRVTPRTLG